MSGTPFKPKVYVKDGCPFSFKFLTSAAEARLLDELEIVRVREGAPDAEATKQRLSEKLGKSATFPTVEVEPDRYMTDSDRLIERFAERGKLRSDALPILSFYKDTIFPKLIEHYKLTSGQKG
jgi:hypothetical protein